MKRSRHHHEDRADREIRLLLVWLRRRLLRAKLTDVVLALTSIALTIVASSQLVVSCQSSLDTAPLVGYGKRQTEAAERFSNSARHMNDALEQAVAKLNYQANATGDLVDVSKQQALIAGDELAMQRPWIGINGGGEHADATNRRLDAVVIRLQDAGHSPATHVNVQLSLMLGLPPLQAYKQNHYSTNPRCQGRPNPSGDTLMLPGVVQDVQFALNADMIDALPNIFTDRIGLFLIGCVDYSDTTERAKYRTYIREEFTASKISPLGGEFHMALLGNGSQ